MMSDSEPREYTKAECREMFLDHVREVVRYWSDPSNSPNRTAEERIAGAAFSILVAIDGEAGALPAFLLVPFPHKDDRKFCRERGDNWWPEAPPEAEAADIIAGDLLHDGFFTTPLGARSDE
jgi:hypothetical protein